MTQLLYQTDSYLKEFQASVIEINSAENSIALDRTAFYPGGGGQPNDLGTIKSSERDFPVTKVKSLEGVVWHWIEGPLPAVRTEVVGQLDWDRRYKLMRTHTALHILCGVIWRDYGAHVTGANIEPLKARMDFELETLPKDLVKDIETKVNLEVQNARPIQIKILPREEAFKIPDLIRTKINLLPEHIKEVRTVEIVGLDLQADGGTHVANTKEVGLVRIIDYQSKGKINKRIYIELNPGN
ncbi:MAG: alanyl-tRNA editing protein [candidate division KSB1 bacterium]|nr:alanyl-tRNA editing protein [candidate division KSB1 bacterium]MDZ7359059.1 alanyl-tRNA editing protein [candidate division KSB1 bacterium]MDZ7376259.1 alanyl-tRNA editing protein [candidate division KSB1 bacterium]MDZ7400028.1 alanyl-tRNA editing protein [candidate division KSB1 bacterium]